MIDDYWNMWSSTYIHIYYMMHFNLLTNCAWSAFGSWGIMLPSSSPRGKLVEQPSCSREQFPSEANRTTSSVSVHLPSGKRLHNYRKSPCYQWDNPLFLWSFSIIFNSFLYVETRPGKVISSWLPRRLVSLAAESAESQASAVGSTWNWRSSQTFEAESSWDFAACWFGVDRNVDFFFSMFK